MKRQLRWLFSISFFVLVCLVPQKGLLAQDYVTGSFEGDVKDSVTGNPIVGAIVRITNQETGVPVAKQTDSRGWFRQGLLPPGDYAITVSKQGYIVQSLQRALPALKPTVVLPPVKLVPESAAAAPAPTPTEPTPAPGQPTPTQPTPAPAPVVSTAEAAGILAEIDTTDARRSGVFTEKEVSTLPLGGTTFTRTFDELALLLPGVALPPQTQGSVAGPGVGAGVGSAGQFAVNGLRSRANNFTVDGSDNNDEDIGVRRQGFLALIPQPIETIKEYQVITLLAPAQFGRNIGAQVNAISKSGTRGTHGAIYGFFNSSQLNSRNPFDTANGSAVLPLRSGSQNVIVGTFANFVFVPSRGVDDLGFQNGQFVPTDGVQKTVTNESDGKDSFTLGQGGVVIGGPLEPERGPDKPPRMYYLISLEGHILNATQEASFAVPTVAQRGALSTGATGIAIDPFTSAGTRSYPNTAAGNAIFSLFPFPNNPNGIYGPNTFTRVLPASGQSKIASGKFDANGKIRDRQQSFTARYNFTDDYRDIPVTGGALFSTLRPHVRTQNFSTFLNSELSGPNTSSSVFNQLRLSYGRTRLKFQEGRDPTFQVPSRRLPNEPFLLNAPLLTSFTLPPTTGVPNTGPVFYGTTPGQTAEDTLGPVGQVILSGFSPLGVDVFNFPQRRANNTYQLADTVTWRAGRHDLTFGADTRRTELNSDLPRNSRPLLTFNGAPRLIAGFDEEQNLTFRFAGPGDPNPFLSSQDFAAAGAPSGFFQTLVQNGKDSVIHLHYYQLDFFGQDEWRVRPNLSFSYGLRYEYNTPPREAERRIEKTFNDPLLSLVPGLRNFIGSRNGIFEPDRNNFAPRVGFAYSADLFGADKATVIRAGYGLFYDQILGAVVGQSRNVFPTFSTINFGGGCNSGCGGLAFNIFNPIRTAYFVPELGRNVPIVLPGTLNTLNPAITLSNLVTTTNLFFGNLFNTPGNSAFGATLPSNKLEMPMAHHYSVTVEQQLSSRMVFSAAYVGTLGRHLLRFTSPNLGPNYLLAPLAFNPGGASFAPSILGVTVPPGTRFSAAGDLIGGRPVSNVGAVNIFETTARSRYDALQVQLRGRMKFLGSSQYQANYTFSSVKDDVSDVFDLAGAPALPQNSSTFAGEYGPANFDARHRVSYNYITDLPHFANHGLQALLGNVQLAGTGQFQTGQPFTVNSIFDINLDGNLTDRLNTTNGLILTGNRSQPLRRPTDDPVQLAAMFLAPIGQDGKVPRNSFRASSLWLTNFAVIKAIPLSEQTRLIFRTEVFNFFNRANFGIPVRFLEAPGFGKATDTVTPARRIQFALKLAF